MSTTPIFDMSKATPIFDMSKAQPIQSSPEPQPNRGFFGTLSDKFNSLEEGLSAFKKQWHEESAAPQPKTREEAIKRNEQMRGAIEAAPGELAGAMKQQAARPLPEDLNTPLYRAATTLSPLVPGLHPEASEAASARGDTGAVLAEAAVPTALVLSPLAAEGVVKGAAKVIPSAERAGQVFQNLSQTIGKHPVAITDDLSNSITALRNNSTMTNATLPPVVQKFIGRVDPFQGMGPLTYDEARTFSSEIGQMSVSDKTSMSANTKRLVNDVHQALKASVQDTADLAGKGQDLSKAMGEYHHAMQLRNVSDTLKEEFWKAVLTGAGIYGAKKIWDAAGP